MPRTKRMITARDVFKIRVPQSVDISRDGESILFAVRDTNVQKNAYSHTIYQVATVGGRVRALTRGKANDSSPLWNPSGGHIAFVSDRQDETQNIWTIPSTGGEPDLLTNLTGGSVANVSWAPDGKSLLFIHRSVPREDPEEKKLRPTYKHITRLHHKMDGMGWYGDERWQLYVVSFPGGRVRRITDGPYDVRDATWSPDGKRIAFLSNRVEGDDVRFFHSDIWTISPSSKRIDKVTRKRGARASVAWSRDSRTIYFLGNHMKAGEFIRHTVPVRSISASGGPERVLTPAIDNWTLNMVITDTLGAFAGPIHVYEDGDEERIAFMLDEEGACRIYSVRADGEDQRVEFAGNVNVANFSVAQNGRAALVVGEMMTAGDIFSSTFDGQDDQRRLSRLNARHFRGLNLTEPEEVWFRNGKTKIQGWILKPPGFRRSRKYPCLLQVHGGPMCQYGYTFFHEMHLLAAEGYVVAFANPRGSSGRGLRYMNCIEGNWGKLDYSDVMAITDALCRAPYIDRRRFGILGGSYGGFMTIWAVGHTQRFKAAVTQRPLGNWWTQYGASDYGWVAKYELGGTPWEKPLRYARHSPNFYVANIHTPLLIIHSEEDLRCPIAQSDELFRSLKLLGRTVEYIRFEGESHGLSRGGKPMNRLERLDRITDWFRRYL